MRNVVPMKWLLARLYEPDLVIVDCRYQLNDSSAGRAAYEQGYIPGAVYFDLSKDLSSPVSEHGGRHPLPDIATFADKLGKAGIDETIRVVAYDDQGGMNASRFWWLLKYLGHEKVYLLDEGFTAWKNAGYPVTNAAPPIRVPKKFTPRPQPDMLADMEDVRTAVRDRTSVLVDSREHKRYIGQEEPIDRIAGHIPTARNRFWKDNVNADGKWKTVEELQERFHDVNNHDNIIVYCGSGVSACPNVVALDEAGFRNVKLYAGSWSDWISYRENPVAVGEE
ncbi:sulfurtransferase [Cohnella pontilimi]|uniref:Sulfurtransferase n=1 Tax=Cohnella pontilimi TaxID=2564100 RepID=A0A4U0F4S7_9BACL|nr:sulfurtransferase [Cohnella pontilimi]TJY39566.1 sulfurtransferase [Cohnella pontilimi]